MYKDSDYRSVSRVEKKVIRAFFTLERTFFTLFQYKHLYHTLSRYVNELLAKVDGRLMVRDGAVQPGK